MPHSLLAVGAVGVRVHCILGTEMKDGAHPSPRPSLIRKKVPIYCWVDRASFPITAWRKPAPHNLPVTFCTLKPLDYGASRISYTVKPVLEATSIKQPTCIKQARIQFPNQANTPQRTCIKQAPVLSKQILTVP